MKITHRLSHKAWLLRRRRWAWWHQSGGINPQRHRYMRLTGPVWSCSCGSVFINILWRGWAR